MKTIYTVFLLLLLLSCTSSSEKLAWEIANNSQTNKKELTRFLEHYKTNKDKDKYKAACFLIENMPNKYSINGKEQKIYDIDIVKADSLIKSLEHSFFLKEKSPYLKNYTFEQFCEYILPYRVADESLQYYWKWDCSRKFEKQCTNDIIQTAQNINAQIKIELSPEFYKDTLKSYSSIIKTGYGKCDDRTALVTMALRSVGIPAAFEFVPYWGSNNNGHSFVSIILPDNKIYPLQNTDKQANGDYYLSRKTPKIYRKMYSIQDLAKHIDNIPELFRHNDLLDVTKLHNIGSCDVTVSTNINKEKENFLSVFSPKRWVPVAFSSSQTFHHIGTGNIYNVDRNKEAIDLGDGIVYLPTHWVNEEAIPIGSPIIVSEDSVREIKPDTKHLERVVCKRKFPLNMRIVDFSKLMIMGVFEGANKADFSDATELYKITKTPESKMQKIEISAEKAYRYIRYRKPKGTFSIAEFCLYQSDEKSIPLSTAEKKAVNSLLIQLEKLKNIDRTKYTIEKQNYCRSTARTSKDGVLQLCQLFFSSDNLTEIDRIATIWHEMYHIDHKHYGKLEMTILEKTIVLNPPPYIEKILNERLDIMYGKYIMTPETREADFKQELIIDRYGTIEYYKNELETHKAERENFPEVSHYYENERTWLEWTYEQLLIIATEQSSNK